MIDKKTIKIFSQKLFVVINSTLPGIFIIEIFFKKGVFSNSPQNLYEFLLLVMWAFVFSVPYNLIDVFCLEDIHERMKIVTRKKLLVTEEGIAEVDKELKKYFKKHKKSMELSDSQTHFMAVICYLFLTLIIYKYLDSHYIYFSVWNFSKSIIIYLNTLLISLPIIYTLTYLVGELILRYQVRIILKKANE